MFGTAPHSSIIIWLIRFLIQIFHLSFGYKDPSSIWLIRFLLQLPCRQTQFIIPKVKKGQPVAAKTITQINRPPSQLFRMQISLTASPNKELTLIFLLLSPQHFYSCATRSAPQRESQILRITNQPACIQFKTMDQKNSNKERNNQLFCVMPPTTMI